jgi:hypothetical protein
MDGARTRAQDLLAQIAPLPDDSELQRLRELSMNYIREAERLSHLKSAWLKPFRLEAQARRLLPGKSATNDCGSSAR